MYIIDGKMKKQKTIIIKSKKVVYNKRGQIAFLKSFLKKNVKRYYQFVITPGS